MTRWKLTWAMVAGAGLWLGARGLAAQVPPEDRIPIMDPDRLEALGFPRDATHVAVWSKLDRNDPLAVDEKAATETETWGAAAGYTTVPGFALQAEHVELFDLVRRLSGAHCIENESANDSLPVYAHAQIPVPEGTRLGQFLFWAYDSHPDFDLSVDVFETCQPNGANPPTVTLIAHNQTFLSIGEYFGFTSLNGLTVNNRSCTYSVRALFVPPGEECIGSPISVRKFQVNWVRQVSPAPPTATFNDVPPSHPYFQFVEALVKAGVAGTRGDGNYYPDAALTRGQMAVFLAKALGLQWP